MTVGTKSNPTQIIQAILDVPNQAIKTTIVGTQVAIAIAANDGDSVITHSVLEPKEDYDYIGYNYATANTIVKTYKIGGSSGTTVGTITEVYTDSTLTRIVSQART
jgi:hypothetical protein